MSDRGAAAMTRTPRWVAAALGLLGLALFAVPIAFEQRGAPLPHTLDVRFLESVDFAVLRQAYPHADLMNGLVLAAGCGIALMAAAVAWRGLGGTRAVRRFFVATAVLLAAVAVEETFEISEAVAEPLGIAPGRTDLALPLVMVGFVVAYRRLFLSSRRAVLLGSAGAVVFALSLVLDTIVARLVRLEDPLESVASLLLLTAYAMLALELLAPASAGGAMEPAEEVIA